MSVKECRFSYSNLDDSLTISCRENNENIRERFSLGSFIFNLTGRGKIVGIQIINASEILPFYNIDPEILADLEKVNLITSIDKGALFIALILVPKQQPEVKISIPLMNFNSIPN